jgi:hypothetical protein
VPNKTYPSFSLRAALAAAALLLVTAGTWIASAAPDGLQHLAANIGLESHPVWTFAPLAGFSRPTAGLAGMACVYAICILGGKRR